MLKFVSTSGNDTTGTGTAVVPWRTLTYAMVQLAPGDILYVRKGTYTEVDTVEEVTS